MSDFFEKVLTNELECSIERFKEANAKLTAYYAHKQMLWSGGHRIQIQEAVCAEIEAYGAQLNKLLTEHEIEHSPISLSDFEEAKTSITVLSVRIANYVQDKQESSQKSFGTPVRLLPDYERVTRAIRAAKLSIDGYREVFRSKRSFWKWAWGDARRRMFAGALFLIGAVASALARSLWTHLF